MPQSAAIVKFPPEKARKRVVIESVRPEIDGGRFPAKRCVGEHVRVEADIVADGHEIIAAQLLFRREQEHDWQIAPMYPLVNDRWRGDFQVLELGRYIYALQAWVDHFLTWQRDLIKRVEAGQDLSLEFLIGADLIAGGARRAPEPEADRLGAWADRLRDANDSQRLTAAQDPDLTALLSRYPDARVYHHL